MTEPRRRLTPPRGISAEKRAELRDAALGTIEAANRLIVDAAAKDGVSFPSHPPSSRDGRGPTSK